MTSKALGTKGGGMGKAVFSIWNRAGWNLLRMASSTSLRHGVMAVLSTRPGSASCFMATRAVTRSPVGVIKQRIAHGANGAFVLMTRIASCCDQRASSSHLMIPISTYPFHADVQWNTYMARNAICGAIKSGGMFVKVFRGTRW